MIPQANPRASYLALQAEIDAAIHCVMARGSYLLGPETSAFENEFAETVRAQFAVGVANGTDALCLALRAVGVQSGDYVLTVSHTAVATATAIRMAGGVPAFVDIESSSFTMAPEALAIAIQKLGAHGKRIGAIVPVHIYGHPADMAAISAIATHYGVPVVEDCAQALGACIGNQPIGSFGTAAAHSFYPTKNLGAFGDGGAVTTNSSDITSRVRSLRQYGWRDSSRVSCETGVNSRLDELQAAILRVKLRTLSSNVARRQAIAGAYNDAFVSLPVTCPSIADRATHSFHLYVLSLEKRDELKGSLEAQGIGAAIHYASPVHLQPAFANEEISLPYTERAAQRVLSLPVYPELSDEQVGSVISAVIAAF